MVIEVKWLDEEKTVIFQRVTNPFSWDEFYEYDKEIQRMMRSVSHPITLLVDLQDFSMRDVPKGALTHIRATMPHFPNHVIRIIAVSNSIFVLSLARIIQRISATTQQIKIYAVRTMEEADEILNLPES